MSVLAHVTTQLADVHAAGLLAGNIPNPAPADPTSGSKGITLLLSYVKWGVLIACAVSALGSGALMATGSLSNRPDNVDKGKRAFLWSLGGVLAAVIAIPMVNTVFGAAA